MEAGTVAENRRPPRCARWYYYPRRCRAVGLRLSRVRRTCHAGCYVWPEDRPRSPRATSSVVGDVERPRCSDAPGDLAASRLAPSPMPTPASGLCHRTCGAKFCAKPSGSPTRDRNRLCKRSSHALRRPIAIPELLSRLELEPPPAQSSSLLITPRREQNERGNTRRPATNSKDRQNDVWRGSSGGPVRRCSINEYSR